MGDSRRHPRAEKRPRRRVAGAARQEAGRTLRRAGNHAARVRGFPAHGAAFVSVISLPPPPLPATLVGTGIRTKIVWKKPNSLMKLVAVCLLLRWVAQVEAAV